MSFLAPALYLIGAQRTGAAWQLRGDPRTLRTKAGNILIKILVRLLSPGRVYAHCQLALLPKISNYFPSWSLTTKHTEGNVFIFSLVTSQNVAKIALHTNE